MPQPIEKRLLQLYLMQAFFLVSNPVAIGKSSTPSPEGNWNIIMKALLGVRFGGHVMQLTPPFSYILFMLQCGQIYWVQKVLLLILVLNIFVVRLIMKHTCGVRQEKNLQTIIVRIVKQFLRKLTI